MITADQVAKHCWTGPGNGLSWENCCAAWDVSQTNRGNVSCWTDDGTYTFDKCCKPRLGSPRSLFLCGEADPSWTKFRRILMLGKKIGEELNWAIKQNPRDCLLGYLTAHLVCLMAFSETDISEVTPFINKVGYLLEVLLRSAISLEEIVFGWPIVTSIGNIKKNRFVSDIFGFKRGNTTTNARRYRTAEEALERMRRLVSPAVVWGTMIDTHAIDLVVSLATKAARNATKVDRKLIHATMAVAYWAKAYVWSSWISPSMTVLWPQIAGVPPPNFPKEGAMYLDMGYEILKHDLLNFPSPRRGGVDVLRALLCLPEPVRETLGLMETAVGVKANALAHCMTESSTCPSWTSLERYRRGIPMTLHVHPKWDSISNHVRAHSGALCTSPIFMPLIEAMTDLAKNTSWPPRRPLRLWEVGANTGDCTIQAAILLRASPHRRRVVGTLFDAVEENTNIALRSLLANNLQGEINAVAMALGSVPAARRQVRIPIGHSAEATLLTESEKPNSAHWIWTDTVWSAPMETADRLLVGDAIPDGLEGVSFDTRPLDILKVHAQGYDLEVIRGARVALSTGKICLVAFYLPRQLKSQASLETSAEVASLLAGFRGIVDMGGYTQKPIVGATAANIRRSLENVDGLLVAWRSEFQCSESPAVLIADLKWRGNASVVGSS